MLNSITNRMNRYMFVRLIVMLGTFLASNAALAGWSANQETIGENKTWLYTPDAPIEGNSKILNGKRALVVTLHGCSQSATELKQFGNWESTAEEYGLIVAIPDVDKGVIAGCWEYDEALDRSGHAQDILKLVQNLKARSQLKIDPQQVYITGLSSGAALALQLVCKAPDVFAGVGSVAGPSVGSDQQGATGSTPPNNISQAISKCNQLAGPQADSLKTQIASLAYGDLDKNGGGTLPIPPPLQGGTSLVDVKWTKDNAQIFIKLFGSSPLGDARSVQGGKGEEYVSTLNDREVVSLVKMFGVGHAWPAGSGDTSLGGGNWLHKVGFNYPAYVTEWFFATNRRVPRPDQNQIPEITSLSAEVAVNKIIVSGNAKDPDGFVKRVHIELVGNQTVSISVNANGDFSHSFADLANGQYTVRVTAIDNQEASSERFEQDLRVGSENVVILDPDVARVFKDSALVNQTLRLLLKLAEEQVPTDE